MVNISLYISCISRFSFFTSRCLFLLTWRPRKIFRKFEISCPSSADTSSELPSREIRFSHVSIKGERKICDVDASNAETRRKFRRRRTCGISVIEFQPTARPNGKEPSREPARESNGRRDRDRRRRAQKGRNGHKREFACCSGNGMRYDGDVPICTVASFSKIIPLLSLSLFLFVSP